MKCKNCGCEIKKWNSVWMHYTPTKRKEFKCPSNKHKKGECGYTLSECNKKYLRPCQDIYKMKPEKYTKLCSCGCNKPEPKYLLVKGLF